MSEKLLFLEEVARILRRSRGQLRHMITAGKAPKCAKIGGRIVFRESDVDAFIEDAFKDAS